MDVGFSLSLDWVLRIPFWEVNEEVATLGELVCYPGSDLQLVRVSDRLAGRVKREITRWNDTSRGSEDNFGRFGLSSRGEELEGLRGLDRYRVGDSIGDAELELLVGDQRVGGGHFESQLGLLHHTWHLIQDVRAFQVSSVHLHTP